MKLYLVLVAAGFLFGCHSNSHSETTDLTFDRHATNQALIFGSPNGLSGIDIDVRLVEEMVSAEQGAYGFEVDSLIPASAEDMLDYTRRAAARLDDNGTLFWYYSGHGAENGDLVGEPGYLNFDDVVAAIQSVRQTPLKRFMVVIDSCFSGQMVNGQRAIGRDDESGGFQLVAADSTAISGKELDHLADGMAQSIFDKVRHHIPSSGFQLQSSTLTEQLLVISASSRDTTSLAGSNGSKFTVAMKDAFDELVNSEATLQDFVDKTTVYTERNSHNHHTPQYRHYPEDLMQEPLMGRAAEPTPPEPPPVVIEEPVVEEPVVEEPVVEEPVVEEPVVEDPTDDAARFAEILRGVNASLRACHIGVSSISQHTTVPTRRVVELLATFSNPDVANETKTSWFDHRNSVEQEIEMFLEAIPRDFFVACIPNDQWQSTSPFVAEENHIEQILDGLNSRLSGCAITATAISGHERSERYTVSLRGAYTTGGEEDTSWSNIDLSAESEIDNFLSAIALDRLFSQCQRR